MGQNIRKIGRLLAPLICSGLIFSVLCAQDESVSPSQSIVDDELLARIPDLEPETAISILMGEVHRASFRGGLTDENPIAVKAAELVVKIDGHAEYLAKKLEEKRGTQD